MDTSVKLQEMLSFSKLPIYITGGLLAAVILYFLLRYLIRCSKKRKAKAVEVKRPVVVQNHTLTDPRQTYLALLDALEKEYQQGICDVRSTYQKMSEIIRDFVFEMTGIKVQNYTLSDIRQIKMPVLEELVEEYYSPEFAERSEGDVQAALDKTRNAIRHWQV
ncbi:MAG: hypothetical protein ACI4DW_10440 [Lachnospiraceae bacterium]